MLRRGDRFLVGKRAPGRPAAGYWTQVSGKMEPGETEQQTAVREAREELGCEIRPLRKLQQLPSHNGQYLLHYWLCEITQGEPAIADEELEELRWVTLEEHRLLTPVFSEDIDLFEALLEETTADG